MWKSVLKSKILVYKYFIILAVLHSSIVSFWITLAFANKYHIFGKYWYTHRFRPKLLYTTHVIALLVTELQLEVFGSFAIAQEKTNTNKMHS